MPSSRRTRDYDWTSRHKKKGNKTTRADHRVGDFSLKLEFAVPVSTGFVSYDKLKKFWMSAERLGYDHLWYEDHLFGRFLIADGTQRIYECWTMLTAIAATTSTIRIGSEMICNNFRSPSLLAKMASTLDVISNGRFELGLGMGWDSEEHRAYGMPFGSYKERCSRLREALSVIKKLWTEERASFHGEYYNINQAYCSPKPLQKPHPPIMLGGSSNGILKIVAEAADGCHMFPPLDKYSKKISALEDYCRKIGREPAMIKKTVGTSIESLAGSGQTSQQGKFLLDEKAGSMMTKDEMIEACVRSIKSWNSIGVGRFSIDFRDMPGTDTLAWFADQIKTQFQ